MKTIEVPLAECVVRFFGGTIDGVRVYSQPLDGEALLALFRDPPNDADDGRAHHTPSR